jgi:TPR repeat protein
MMLSGDKRASLSSNLLDGASEGATHQPQQAASGAAKSDDTVLYNKGAASASGFRPRHWSYDAQPADHAATVTPFPASAAPRATPAREPAATSSRARAGMIALGAFSAVALLASASMFVLSRMHDAGVPAEPTPSTIVAAAPAPSVVVTPPAPPITPAVVAPASVSPPPAASAQEPAPQAEIPTESRPQPVPSSHEEKPIVASPPSPPPLAPAEIEELVTRGGRLLATGDIAAARVFFERAAEQGNAGAATAAGKTYDPLYLEEAHVRGIRGDPVAAAKWYRRASAAGDKESDLRMKKLIARYAG